MSKNLKFMKPKSSNQQFVKASQIMGAGHTASWTQHKSNEMLKEGYEGNTWVFACIRKKMQAAGAVPLILQEYQEDAGYREFEKDHPLKKLLANPCPGLSGSQFKKMVVGQLEVQGQFFGKIIFGGRGGNVPVAVWPLPIGSTHALEKDNEVVGFKYYTRSGKTETLSVKEVVHIRYTHPDTIFKGMASLQAAGKAVDIDNEAADWQKISMQNRGIPDGVFTMQGDVEVDEWEEARRQVRDQYTGKDNAREPWVVANATFHQMSQSMAEMDFVNGRKMTREEICAGMDVPPPIVGILDDANYSNIETARKIFWRDTMLPILADIADQLSRKFISANQKFRLTFDTTNVSALQDSLTEKLTSAKDLFGMGVPLSVINKRLEMDLDLEDVSGSNVGYLPGALMPVNVASESRESSESDSENNVRMSDEDFDRLTVIMDKVLTGQMSRDAALKLAKVSLPGIPEADINALIPEAQEPQE